MQRDNLEILHETLEIINTRRYGKPKGVLARFKKASLKLRKKQMREAIVLSHKKIRELKNAPPFDPAFNMGGKCWFSVSNTDTFAAAINISKDCLSKTSREKLLVLNFANPVEPGGGVRRGAKAQEEDLCRKSTLLASLESDAAKEMYEFNKRQSSVLFSDYMILSPNVEIFRDENNNLLKETVIVAVLTAPAPFVSRGTDGISQEKIEAAFYQRIMGVLHVATTYGYKRLVLGAWGCGAFGNDPDMVARLFYKAFKEVRCGEWPLDVNSLFDRVEFAVLDNSHERRNFSCFEKYFSDFHRDEREAERQSAISGKLENEKWLDAIRGCLVGGAVGDALGYPVEFLSQIQIQRKFGGGGITGYDIDSATGKAIISDDTQMTLFTANGILYGATRAALRGISGPVEGYVHMAYIDWLATQTGTPPQNNVSWLTSIAELHKRRAPGTTCLNALESGVRGSIEKKINDSKGCGGVMRVAPVALYFKNASPKLLLDGAKIAAITHGHPLGYMPAAALVFIISRIVYGGCAVGESIYDIVKECQDVTRKLFKGTEHLDEFLAITELAVTLSKNKNPDAQNIHLIGQGWVAEEAFAIALYCSLKYYSDFSAAIIAAVNHDGDSDSTGAITGNIVGAHVGYKNIPQKWKTDLQLHDVIVEIADDICHECQMDEYSSYVDEDWMRKYGGSGSFFINAALRGVDLKG